MPPRKKVIAAGAVTVRLKAPEQQDVSEDEALALLYRPVPQLDGLPNYKVKYEWFDQDKAKEWLRKSEDNAEFRQRPTRTADVRRWRNLQLTKRFVNFLPDGPICVDPEGIMLNGKHRFSALAGLEHGKFGFMVLYNVPRWMFVYFDTNRVRTIKDVFHIGARATGPQTSSAMRLGMRYEEFLAGVRQPQGWRHWMLVKDEPYDVDDFLARRTELQDWYGVGEKVYRFAKLLIPSVMAFRFYQSLAWPEGDEKINDFCESLVTGGNLAPQSPTLQLRDWSKEVYYNKERLFAKRELHLLLLMRTFEQHVRGSRIPKLNWAYGLPMGMPYHPDGHEIALKNVAAALTELDEEAVTLKAS